MLWGIAPHIIWPLRFVLPHHRGLRPAWLLRLGLFLYDHLGGRKRLPATRTLRLARHAGGALLKPEYTLGFEYSDCWVEDSRLVVLNARDAADRGARIAHAHALHRRAIAWTALWQLDAAGRAERRAHARCARARWSTRPGRGWRTCCRSVLRANDRPPMCAWSRAATSSSRGSMPRITATSSRTPTAASSSSSRTSSDFTLIGTTDRDYQGDPAQVARLGRGDRLSLPRRERISARARSRPIRWSGPIPACARSMMTAAQRGAGGDARLRAESRRGEPGEAGAAAAALGLRRQDHDLSPPGRSRAGQAGAAICRRLPGAPPGWTGRERAARRRLPDRRVRDACCARCAAPLSRSAGAPLRRLLRAYGTRVEMLLDDAQIARPTSAECFGADLTEAELRYLVRTNGFATGAQDVALAPQQARPAAHARARSPRSMACVRAVPSRAGARRVSLVLEHVGARAGRKTLMHRRCLAHASRAAR